MKKLLVVLGLALAAFSFQASAAQLTLKNVFEVIPGNTIGGSVFAPLSTTGTDSVVAGEAVAGTFTSWWRFGSDTNGLGEVIVSTNPKVISFVTNVWVNGINILTTASGALDDVFNLSFLSTDIIDIIVTGSTKTGQQALLDVSVSSVPVPAAVWLFGSALMGLTGISRRKGAKA